MLLHRKTALVALLAAIFVSFFGTLIAGAWMFPRPYDWRSRVISNLLSPRDNPGHYWLPASGVVITGLLLFPFAGHLRRQLESVSPRAARLCWWSLVSGFGALICAGVIVPQHTHAVLGMPRLHEIFARSAAILLAIGMLCGCWCALRDRGHVFTPRLLAVWLVVTLLPLAGIVLSESLLVLANLHFAWALPVKTALRHSALWHLGFWEWTGSAAFFVFLFAAVFWLPIASRGPRA